MADATVLTFTQEDFVSNIIIRQVSVSAATHESRVGSLSEQNKEGVQP